MYIEFIQLLAEEPTTATNDEVKSNLSSRIGGFRDIIPGENIAEVIGTIVNYALSLAALIAIAMIIYGGFLYITSGGDEQKSKQGQTAMTYAIIGLIITLAAVVIINQVKNVIGAN